MPTYDPSTGGGYRDNPDIPYYDGSGAKGGYGAWRPPASNIGGGGGFGSFGGGFYGSDPSGAIDPWGGGAPRRRRMQGGPMQASYQTATRPYAGGGNPGGGAPPSGGGLGYRNGGYSRFQHLMDRGVTGEEGGGTRLNWEQLADMIIGGGGEGMYGPEGDPRIMRMLDEDAAGRGLDLEQGALTAADIEHADPWTRAQVASNARMGTLGARSRIGSEARMSQAQRYQDLVERLFLGKLGGDYTLDDDLTRERWGADREGAARASAGKTMPWQIVGDIAGRAVGAAAGGGGGGRSMSRSRGNDEIMAYLNEGRF